VAKAKQKNKKTRAPAKKAARRASNGAKGSKSKGKTAKTGRGKASVKRVAKKSATKKKAAKKSAAKKPAAKKPAAKKPTAKKPTAKKPTAKKIAGKVAGKTAAKAAKKVVKKPATKAPAKKTASKKAAAKTRAAGRKRLRRVGEPVSGGSEPPSSKRNFGLRGAAPWVARHAAKHAEELRKRNAEPPPPGSARATLRVPPEAEEIKSKIGELHQAIGKVRGLRKRFEKSFYEIGEILWDVQQKQLHEAKGYSSFESFLDREVDLPRNVSLRLIRITHTFRQDTAYDFGLERLTSALQALDGELVAAPPSHPSSRGFSSTALPPRPPLRFDD
jgi:hypothetical protein